MILEKHLIKRQKYYILSNEYKEKFIILERKGEKVNFDDKSIVVSEVVKSFGVNQILRGVNFSVGEGEIVALLGHNGAGKTTLLRIILGLLDFDSGVVSVFGNNPLTVNEDIRKICGVLSEDTGLYESLTVYDNLKFFAEVYGCPREFYEKRIDELLEKFDILDKKNDVIKKFSMGMKKKIAIIRTVLHNPKIVLFDEPVNFLDPISIEILHDLMKKMKVENNTTFIITTHNLDEVMKICDKVVILKNGKSVVQTTLQMKPYLRTCIELIDGSDTMNVIQLMKKFGLEFIIDNNEIMIKTSDKLVIANIIKELVVHNVPICGVTREKFDLGKLYMGVEEKEYEKNNEDAI